MCKNFQQKNLFIIEKKILYSILLILKLSTDTMRNIL